MKAIGFYNNLPIAHPESLLDLDLPAPVPQPRDVLLAVQAVSVNPVDVKVRAKRPPRADGRAHVLGWDAVGTVQAVGAAVTRFRPGDRVWAAGSIARDGSNSELLLVDERIASLAPRTLSDADAAALPLTGITAWELLFDRLGVPPAPAAETQPGQDVLLVIGAAGGVGSVLLQLARQLTGLTVIGTASRPETRDWALGLGAHHVIDHHRPMAAQLAQIGVPAPRFVASLTQSDAHFEQIADLIAPQGRLALIDDPAPIDVRLLKTKSVSLHWELMFTRSMFETPDMEAQHRLLAELAALVDAGRLRSTATESLGRIDAANLKRAHALIESGRARGKVVLSGF